MPSNILEPPCPPEIWTVQTFDRRTCLANDTGYFWFLKEGMVRSFTWTPKGTLLTLGIWEPGDILGQSLCHIEPYRMECLTLVKAIRLPIDQLCHYTTALLNHLQHTTQLLEIVQEDQAEVALLRLLNWLADRFGQHHTQGRKIVLRLTHQELAALSGLTRVTVTRLLNLFEQQGLIRRYRQLIIVLPKSKLMWNDEL